MDRSSKSITLALLGSTLFLSGCKAKNDEAARLAAEKRARECEIARKEGRNCPPEPTSTANRGGRGIGFIPIFIPSGRSSAPASGAGSGTATSSGASARGGFGASGAAASSSAS